MTDLAFEFNMATKSLKTSIITSVISLGIIFTLSTEIIYLILNTYLSKEVKNFLKFPRTLKDVKILYDALTGHENNNIHVLICYVATYIFVMLSVLGGTLWGSWNALILVSFVRQPIIQNYLSERMERWNEKLNAHRKGLFSYIIFLKTTPFLPNWFINIASPHLGVGVGVFYWATFFGVAPLSFIHIQAGDTIHRLSETDEFTFLTIQNVVTVSLVAIAALIPIILGKRFESQEKSKVG
ncbi:1065_t:CDS:2 [Rhizophagus irregularis]|nr:1065_t:CDS:2 [Rhizophagus irregularis]